MGGGGRIGTTGRGHQLEKVGKHWLKESTLYYTGVVYPFYPSFYPYKKAV